MVDEGLAGIHPHDRRQHQETEAGENQNGREPVHGDETG